MKLGISWAAGLFFSITASASSFQSCARLLGDNISPAGAVAGTVVASPSQSNPDYYYHWVRDAGLVMLTWLEVADLGIRDVSSARVDKDLKDFWQLTLRHQQQDLPGGLGEVKFHVDGNVFRGEWGRPQNDGPAIRALALMSWRRRLLQQQSPLAHDPTLYSSAIPAQSAIKRDLEYVSHHWTDTDFDVWEEVKGHHFFTRLFQMYSLRQGAELAASEGDQGAADWYLKNSKLIQAALEYHWDSSRGFINATIDRDGGLAYKSGLDSAVIIAVLETTSFVKPGDIDWTVLDPRVQATVLRLETEFTKIYAINSQVNESLGPMIGRYPEDTYDGVRTGSRGNPWLLNTHYVAEFYYQLAEHLAAAGELKVTDLTRAFWSRFMNVDAMTLKSAQQPQWNALLRKLISRGDAIRAHAQSYVSEAGNMAEQVNRESGSQVGARDLSWSYSSFLRNEVARRRVDSILQRN